MQTDEQFMGLALRQADAAAISGEVPVGAVLVKDGRVIVSGHNAAIQNNDPTAHAEMVALRAAAQALGNYRLEDCELFVTLEPCAMCAGAMLHSRLKRVVFGAFDPKTGAAGSVINLFEQPLLNHRTQVQGGVLADECAQLLKTFFQTRRDDSRFKIWPLREDAVRTPDIRFANLIDYSWSPHYLNDLDTLDGLRMHYLDEGPPDATLTYLCLHGKTGWSYIFRHLLPGYLAQGARVVAPDLIGFGKSDKPKRVNFHRLDWQHKNLLEWVERLDLKNVVLVLQDADDALGLGLSRTLQQRYSGQMLLAPALVWNAAERLALEAPFPDSGHRSALRAYASLLP